MNLDIDMEAVQAAVNETITTQVAQAAVSYETKKRIGEAIGAAFAGGAIMAAVEEGCRKADVDAIASAVVAEVVRTATKVAVLTMREAMVDTVCKLRGVYSDEQKARVRAELTTSPAPHDSAD